MCGGGAGIMLKHVEFEVLVELYRAPLKDVEFLTPSACGADLIWK